MSRKIILRFFVLAAFPLLGPALRRCSVFGFRNKRQTTVPFPASFRFFLYIGKYASESGVRRSGLHITGRSKMRLALS